MSYLLHFSALVRTEIEKKHIPKCIHFRSTFRKEGLYFKKVTHTVLKYPFIRMIKKKCKVVDAEKLNLMLWKIYMVSSRKEEFVTAAKKELQPYLTKKDEKQIDTTYDTTYTIDRRH